MSRILQVASLIHHQPRKWTRRQLAQRLGVDITTIQRYINILRQMGVGIEARGRDGYEMITDFFLPALNLDFQEALSLMTAASFYRANEGRHVKDALDSAIAKITSNLPTGTNRILEQLTPQIDFPDRQVSPIDDIQPHRDTLYEGIRERRKVNLTYTAFSSGKKMQHRFAPYAVMFRRRAWYVIGQSHRVNHPLTLRINRIEKISVTHEPYTIPEDFSVQKYMAKSWEMLLGPETYIVIDFEPRVAPLIQGVRWHSTQQMHSMPDGKLRFEVTVAGWQEIGWWGHEGRSLSRRRYGIGSWRQRRRRLRYIRCEV